MADFLDWLPLFPEETEDAILGRWIDWANAGLGPGDPRVIDTREGSMSRTLWQPALQEFARLYDLAGAEIPASASVLSSWSGYLDLLADLYDTSRDPATPATGIAVFSGPPGKDIALGLRIQSSGTPATDPIEFSVAESGVIGGGGTVELPIVAVVAGAAGNVAANSITQPVTPLPAGTTVNNPDATRGGLDTEGDPHLQGKIEELFRGREAGAQLDYVIETRKWLKANYPLAPRGGTVSCIPVWDGAGTVKVIAMDDEGNPIDATTGVDPLQLFWDPGATGHGEGHAPVSAAVTVETATVLPLTITGTIFFEPGYTLDGAGGTVQLLGPITDALTLYLLGVDGGTEVVFSKVEAAIAGTDGVHDLTGLQVDGGTANIALVAEPPQVPRLGVGQPALTPG